MGEVYDLQISQIPVQAKTDLLCAEFYALYHLSVQNYLHKLCGSLEQAEDLTQETFIKACRNIQSFRGESSPRTWLFQIARNNYLNTVQRANFTTVEVAGVQTITDTSVNNDPVRQYMNSEQRGQILSALKQLPEKQCSILLLRDLEDLSYNEIAEIMSMSLAAVKVNLFRARNAFRSTYLMLEATLERLEKIEDKIEEGIKNDRK